MTNIRIDVSRIESDEEDRDGVSDEDLDLFRECSSLPCLACMHLLLSVST